MKANSVRPELAKTAQTRVDEMESHEMVTQERLLEVLLEWEADPFVWLPSAEVKKRIRRLR